MGLFSAVLGGAALLAIENAQRKAEERAQRQAAQQQPPPAILAGLWPPFYVPNPYRGVVNPWWLQPVPPAQPQYNVFEPNMGTANPWANPWSPFQPVGPAQPQHNAFDPVLGAANPWPPFQPNVPDRARENAVSTIGERVILY